jgi:hypothetical protein
MKIKEIPNMGKIIFDKFYNSANIIINDINMSPIKNSKLIKIVDENDANKLINNHYIYSLLEKRKQYYVYECNPKKLTSRYRYDIYVKYFYVKSYIEKNNYDLAKNIYLSHIKAFNNFFEPDGSKSSPNNFIDNFNILIESIKAEGLSKTIIPISKTGIPIDGAHRLAICLYLKIKAKFLVFDLLDAKYDKEFFISRGMIDGYCEIIDNLAKEKGWKL